MSSERGTVVQGLGLLDVLAVVFIVLRLCGVIHWSWWWVLAPIWMPLALIVVVVVIVGVVTAAAK